MLLALWLVVTAAQASTRETAPGGGWEFTPPLGYAEASEPDARCRRYERRPAAAVIICRVRGARAGERTSVKDIGRGEALVVSWRADGPGARSASDAHRSLFASLRTMPRPVPRPALRPSAGITTVGARGASSAEGRLSPFLRAPGPGPGAGAAAVATRAPDGIVAAPYQAAPAAAPVVAAEPAASGPCAAARCYWVQKNDPLQPSVCEPRCPEGHRPEPLGPPIPPEWGDIGTLGHRACGCFKAVR